MTIEPTDCLTRRRALVAMAKPGLAAFTLPLLGSLALSQEANAQKVGELRPVSIYWLKYEHSQQELIGDLLNTERGDPQREAEIAHQHWYSHETRRRWGAWGPGPRTYAPLEGLASRSLQWKRERVIATAARFIGYGYQHHHIPDWNPPANWPWKETCVGHNGKGFDCSNFTSFVYNQGFGIHMSSGIGRQSRVEAAFERGGQAVHLHTIEFSDDYRERQKTLHTGDLLYIRGREEGPITHVVIWIGSVGRAPHDIPLILDSHGAGVVDEAGQHIPCGVHLRPFRESSWYNRCASHAHRVFHG